MTRTLELVSWDFIELKQGVERFRLLSSILVIFEQFPMNNRDCHWRLATRQDDNFRATGLRTAAQSSVEPLYHLPFFS